MLHGQKGGSAGVLPACSIIHAALHLHGVLIIFAEHESPIMRFMLCHAEG